MINKPKSHAELEAMRLGGRMLAQVLKAVVNATQPGMRSLDLANIASKELKSLGGEPAFLGVMSHEKIPFPDIICISINEEVQHGVPSERVINSGDIVNFDFGVKYKGMITDAGLTIGVGKLKPPVEKLLKITQKALYNGLKQVKAGAKVYQISQAIEETLLKADLGIVRELVGHGVGHSLHEDPEIPNFVAGSSDYTLKENQTIAVEPIASLGSGRIEIAKDGWTLLAEDRKIAAHFEHTIRVTNNGYEILTPWNDLISVN